MSRHRSGLNIGEGAAFFIMTRESCDINFSGAGESCDAWHMSAPHPEGLGAEACMRDALTEAGLEPGQIGYLNLHGTGTPQNDIMEAKAVARVFGQVPCSSTKPMVGHCLGAAGAQEAAFCWLSMKRAASGYPLLPHVWDGEADPEFETPSLVASGDRLAVDGPAYFMSNSFAFGGNNCSIILEHRPESREAS
jgi:3-oxoacyl-[acyl-carrier-protein] synthase-1